ncbi:MAG: energy transducer TonB [Actinomycetota bacterium]
MSDADALTWDGPIALSQHDGLHRSLGMAVGLHLLVAAALLAWPASEPQPDEAPVVEIVFAPPPPAVEAPPPPQAQPQPQPQPVAKPAAPVQRTAPRPAAAPSPSPAPVAAAESSADAAPTAAPSPAGSVGPAAAAVPSGPSEVAPTAVDTPKPTYPLAARRKGWEGVVVLNIEVDLLGCPTTVAIKASSGHAALDEAAVEAARRWHFTPARKDGKATAASVEVPIRFSLKDA